MTPTVHRGHCRTCEFAVSHADRRAAVRALNTHQQQFQRHIVLMEAPDHG